MPLQKKLCNFVVILLMILVPSVLHAALPAPGGDDANLSLWLKADAGITGAPITSWTDQSGSGNTVVHSPGITGGTETGPDWNDGSSAYAINYNPVTTYGPSEHLQIQNNTLGITTNHDIFVVRHGRTQTAANALYFGIRPLDQSTDGIMMAVTSSLGELYTVNSDTDNSISVNGLVSQTVPQLMNAHSDGSEMSLFENGRLLATDTTLTSPAIAGTHETWIGSFPAGTNTYGNHIGDIAEVVVYTDAKGLAARMQIQSYLALKYGLWLDGGATDYVASSGAVVWDASLDSTHTYDVFGVGRDDNSSLSQVQSRSTQFDSVIVLEVDGEGTNAVPSFSDMADGEFLVIANNNGTATWTGAGAPTDQNILGRTWRIQETGDVGTVSLTFDVADTTFNIPEPLQGSAYYFLYDSDNDGSLEDELAVGMTNTSGSLWRVSGINFTDGQKFTLTDSTILTDVHRFWSDTYQSHFYTRSLVEKDFVQNNYDDAIWRYEGVGYTAFQLPGTDRSPVYRFWSDLYQSHFYTISRAEQLNTITDSNWKYEEISWYAYASDGPDRTPMYRFWSEENKSHFYTTSTAERNVVFNNDAVWSYEGIVYYVPTI